MRKYSSVYALSALRASVKIAYASGDIFELSRHLPGRDGHRIARGLGKIGSVGRIGADHRRAIIAVCLDSCLHLGAAHLVLEVGHFPRIRHAIAYPSVNSHQNDVVARARHLRRTLQAFRRHCRATAQGPQMTIRRISPCQGDIEPKRRCAEAAPLSAFGAKHFGDALPKTSGGPLRRESPRHSPAVPRKALQRGREGSGGGLPHFAPSATGLSRS